MTDFLIGSSTFTAVSWLGSFYPDGLPEREYLTDYATKFDIAYRFPWLGWCS
jgi:uncharacterized protein YecE (DUF72 family)